MCTKNKNQHQHNQSERREPHADVQVESARAHRNPVEPSAKKKWLHVGLANLSKWSTVVVAATSIFMVLIVTIQTCYTRRSINESTGQFNDTIDEIKTQSETLSRILIEQQRARLSFRIELEETEVRGETAFRIVCPIEIGGTTEARRVRFKNYVSTGQPGHRQYISSVDVDWENRVAHDLSDVSPTEIGRQFVAEPLSRQQIATIVSENDSLYVVARLEYCDIYGDCRYFMRCAELGNGSQLVTYCGTRIGDLKSEAGDDQS